MLLRTDNNTAGNLLEEVHFGLIGKIDPKSSLRSRLSHWRGCESRSGTLTDDNIFLLNRRENVTCPENMVEQQGWGQRSGETVFSFFSLRNIRMSVWRPTGLMMEIRKIS